MEIVSEPDIRSPEEAADYLRTLQSLLRSVGASDGNMEQVRISTVLCILSHARNRVLSAAM